MAYYNQKITISGQVPKIWNGEPSVDKLFKGCRKYNVTINGKSQSSIIVNKRNNITHAIGDLKKYEGKPLKLMMMKESPILDLIIQL